MMIGALRLARVYALMRSLMSAVKTIVQLRQPHPSVPAHSLPSSPPPHTSWCAHPMTFTGRNSVRAPLIIGLAFQILSGCTDRRFPTSPHVADLPAPTPADPPPATLVQPAQSIGHYALYANVVGTPVQRLTIQVSGDGIDPAPPVVLQTTAGIAPGTISVLNGGPRTITVRAFDGAGTETHFGSLTLGLGEQRPIPISVNSSTGYRPVTLWIGKSVAILVPTWPTLTAGDTVRLSAVVVDSLGAVAGVEPTWTTQDATKATITNEGLLTAHNAGTVQIRASFAGVDDTITLRVLSRDALIAHRGFMQVFPENTIPAIQGSGKLGATGIEFDVHFTADGVPVLMHDATVDRTTDGSGQVSQLTLEQVRKLDACKKASRGQLTCSVPTLREALSAGSETDLIIHIKEHLSDGQMRLVLDEVYRARLHAQVTLLTHDYGNLQSLRALDRTVRLGWLNADIRAYDMVRNLGNATQFFDQMALLANPGYPEVVKRKGFHIGVYALVSKAETVPFYAMGVSYFVANNPLLK
jgi:glycerophosphoryl diester phosphodiesterase